MWPPVHWWSISALVSGQCDGQYIPPIYVIITAWPCWRTQTIHLVRLISMTCHMLTNIVQLHDHTLSRHTNRADLVSFVASCGLTKFRLTTACLKLRGHYHFDLCSHLQPSHWLIVQIIHSLTSLSLSPPLSASHAHTCLLTYIPICNLITFLCVTAILPNYVPTFPLIPTSPYLQTWSLVHGVLDSRSKALGFDSHSCTCVEVLSKLLIPYCLCLPSSDGYLVERESYIVMIGCSCSRMRKCWIPFRRDETVKECFPIIGMSLYSQLNALE